MDSQWEALSTDVFGEVWMTRQQSNNDVLTFAERLTQTVLNKQKKGQFLNLKHPAVFIKIGQTTKDVEG